MRDTDNHKYYCSHGSFGLWGAYLAGGDVVVPNGHYGQTLASRTSPNEQASLFMLKTAKLMNWMVIWDKCYRKGRSGVLTMHCAENKSKYGIE